MRYGLKSWGVDSELLWIQSITQINGYVTKKTIRKNTNEYTMNKQTREKKNEIKSSYIYMFSICKHWVRKSTCQIIA